MDEKKTRQCSRYAFIASCTAGLPGYSCRIAVERQSDRSRTVFVRSAAANLTRVGIRCRSNAMSIRSRVTIFAPPPHRGPTPGVGDVMDPKLAITWLVTWRNLAAARRVVSNNETGLTLITGWPMNMRSRPTVVDESAGADRERVNPM